MEPIASICMASHDRPSVMIRRVLDSIYCQSPPFEFEVVLADDGPPYSAESFAMEYPIVYHKIERPPGFRNPCIARNAAYHLARAPIVIAQSDDVVHVLPDTIERLVTRLVRGTFLLATVRCLDRNDTVCGEFTGPGRHKPYFFLGALFRDDLYGIGGNDEDFAVATAYEDDWFADCLIYGRGLRPVYDPGILGYHLWHPTRNDLTTEWKTKRLYHDRHHAATRGEIPWQASGGPWPMKETAEETFTRLHRSGTFFAGSPGVPRESDSGPGSSMEATRAIREALPRIVTQLGAKTFFDMACGDCNWMQHVTLGVELYIGADIVKELVEQNAQRLKGGGRRFVHLDLLSSDLPQADLVLCRDCLVHLSNQDVLKAIANLKRSGSRYFLTTTFPARPSNGDIETGGWYAYNLQKPPFSFPSPIELVNEGCRESYPQFKDKSLGLWKLAELP